MYIEKIFGKQNITLEDIKNLLAYNNEHRDVEFKECVDDKNYIKNFIKPIVGLANANGGLLIIGVSDGDKKIIGIENKPKHIDTLNNWIKNIEPSLSKHYNIMQIKLDEEKSIYLVDVEPTGSLYALKENNHFVYYIRKGPSTEEINPNEIIKIACQKENYEYNKGYRKGLLGGINNAIQEIARFLDIKEIDFIKFIEDKNINELMNIIKNAKTKNLSINIYQEVLHLNSNILYINEKAIHKNLTFEEESTKIDLLDNIQRVYDFNKKLNNNDIMELNNLPIYWLNNKKFNDSDINIYTSLSLLGFIKNIYGYYEFIHDDLQKYLTNYENNLNDILKNIDLIYKDSSINKEIICDLKDMLEKFSVEMAKELINIITIALFLKKAIKQVLYLE